MSLANIPMIVAQAGQQGGAMSFVPLVVVGVIFYFLLIRPQQRQQKELQEMQSALKKGDDVVTSSGLLGKIFAIDEKVVTLEVATGVKVRMLKNAVQSKVTVEPAKTDSAEAKKEEK